MESWAQTGPRCVPGGCSVSEFMVVMMTWGARSAWEEAHTRRSNVDLIAAVLGKKASEGDLIVVQDAWDGITFDRYYHGRAHWVTVPPIDSHKVHRNDLVLEKLNQPDPMAPVLREITNTLRNGNSVWIVEDMSVVPRSCCHRHAPPDCQWWLPYLNYWNAQVTTHLRDHALQEQDLGNTSEWAGEPPGESFRAAVLGLQAQCGLTRLVARGTWLEQRMIRWV